MTVLRTFAVWLGLTAAPTSTLDCSCHRDQARYGCLHCDYEACEAHRGAAHDCEQRRAEREDWP